MPKRLRRRGARVNGCGTRVDPLPAAGHTGRSHERRTPMQQPWTAENGRYEIAQFRRCGRSGLDLPAISLGLWQNFGGADVYENGRAILRRAFDRGVTHFDLANNYG